MRLGDWPRRKLFLCLIAGLAAAGLALVVAPPALGTYGRHVSGRRRRLLGRQGTTCWWARLEGT